MTLRRPWFGSRRQQRDAYADHCGVADPYRGDLVAGVMARRRKSTCANPMCRAVCVPGARGLCESCLKGYRAQHDRDRIGKRDQSHYQGQWPKIRRETIRRHIAAYGYICTLDCGTAHPDTNPLTVDHVRPRSLDEGTQVLCRRCNSKKGAKHG